MKVANRFAAVIILAVLALTLGPVYAGAAGSHLGVNPSQIITLVATPNAPPPTQWTFKRLLPDNTIESGEYVVPKGKVLIITDIEYPNPSTVGAALSTNLSTGGFYYLGTEAFKEHFTAGFVVPQETALKIVVPTNTILSLTVLGYLAPAK